MATKTETKVHLSSPVALSSPSNQIMGGLKGKGCYSQIPGGHLICGVRRGSRARAAQTRKTAEALRNKLALAQELIALRSDFLRVVCPRLVPLPLPQRPGDATVLLLVRVFLILKYSGCGGNPSVTPDRVRGLLQLEPFPPSDGALVTHSGRRGRRPK